MLPHYWSTGETGIGAPSILCFTRVRRPACRAHRALRGQPSGLTLSTTALVHESYLKLIGNERVSWQDRAHFLALAARAMRFVLVSYA